MKLTSKGQTLVEISIVFGIASIVIVSLVILASSSLRQAQESVRRVSASKLASAGIESVIFYKNINGFSSLPFPPSVGGTKCVKMALTESATTLQDDTGCSGDTVFTPDGLSYVRTISTTQNSSNNYTTTVTVSWKAGTSSIDSIKLSRIITNYDY